jgi:hypothetical protein
MSSTSSVIFETNVDKSVDLHRMFSNLCNNPCGNIIRVDSRYFKLLVKHNIDLDLIQDYICNSVAKVLLTHSNYELHVNLKSFSLLDFERNQPLVHRMTTLFRAKFANKIGKCYLHNTSFLFKAIYSFFKRIMSKDDLENIVFVKDE